MKILPLIIAPNRLLKKISRPVEKIDADLQKFMQDMLNTMYNESGVGLAAVQVGVLKRILVIDTDYKIEDQCHHHNSGEFSGANLHQKFYDDSSHNSSDNFRGNCGMVHVVNANPRFFINPEIIEFSKENSAYNEGCLSFPGARSQVIRPQKVKVKYLDQNACQQIEEMEGLLATCIQHEIDHLNGITFVDHISKLKRDLIVNKMKKLQKNDTLSLQGS
jgi:peptide deformylase